MNARHSLLAVSAAKCLGLGPTDTPRDTTSGHGDGRDHRDAEPEAQVVPITKGYRRDHRPDLNHVLWELMVAHQAGIPILMTPRRGTSRDPQTFGQVSRAHLEPGPPGYGATDVVADRALYRADNRDTLAQTARKWIPRVPATWSEAQAALAAADPQAMAVRPEGDRHHELTSTYGGVEQRWGRLSSEPRRVPAQRTLDK